MTTSPDAGQLSLTELTKGHPLALKALRELRRDAARYRWLRDKSEDYPSGPWPVTWDNPDRGGRDDTHPCVYDELDAAIDAVIESSA